VCPEPGEILFRLRHALVLLGTRRLRYDQRALNRSSQCLPRNAFTRDGTGDAKVQCAG